MLARYQSVVFCVGANPDPQESRCIRHGKRTVVNSHASRPQLAGLFEMKGWVTRVTLEQSEALIGNPLYFRWQSVVAAPETSGRSVHQSGLVLPDLASPSASSTRKSSLPAALSRSICASHVCQSFSTIQSWILENWSVGNCSMARSISSTVVMMAI